MNPTVRSLLRFWWLVLAGLILGALAGYLVLHAKTHKRYTATAKIFVDSPSGPYLRTLQPQVTRQNPRSRIVRVPGTNGKSSTTRIQSIPSAPVVVSQAPDTDTLVKAANLYPQIIMSDPVVEGRNRTFGDPPPGCKKIDSLADKASTNTFGVFKASPVPVVDITANCKGREEAKNLATHTVEAFRTWVVAHQRIANIPRSQRLIISDLSAASETKTIGNPSAGLPVFVGVVVFLLFCGIAILLDRPRPDRVVEVVETPQPANTRA
jgi:hypothetical protein